MVYPVLLPLLPLMRTPRLPELTPPADLNGLVRFAERRNLVSTRVPSHFKRILPTSRPAWGATAVRCYSVTFKRGKYKIPVDYINFQYSTKINIG